MSKQKYKAMHIAFFAIVLLFIAVVSFTGAWYTSHPSSPNVNFGDLEMGAVTLDPSQPNFTSKSKTLNQIAILPTMQIDISAMTYTGTVNAYYRIEIVSSNEKDSSGANFTGDKLTTLHNTLSQATVYNAVQPNGTIAAQSITIPSTLGNDYQGASATLTVTITVLQQPNLGGGLTPEAAQSAFQQAGI